MMTKLHQPGSASRFASRQRWLVLAVVSLVLHMVLLGWADGGLRHAAPAPQASTVIVAALHAPPALPAPVAVATPPAPAIKSPPKPKRVAPPAVAAPAIFVPPLPVETSTSLAGVAENTSPSPQAPPNTSKEATLPEAVEITVATAEPAPPLARAAPPPSAGLTYAVHALRDGKDWYGNGEIKWQSDGRDYLVTGVASVSALMFKITALNFWSKGQIDDYGIAPLIYSETRFRKAETNTHFRREPDIISFSASTTTYPRAAGAQDRASIMWQLAAIGNGDPAKFVPGTEIELFVAGVRDAETWRIRVIGEEQIELGIGKVGAWHVARAPRSGSYEQKIDIWLAPQHHWYPVKILYTEVNGDYLDMSLSRLENAAP